MALDLTKFEGKLIKDGKDCDAKGAEYYGIYFSAHWCPPCRGFTPQLAEFYKKVKANGENFEIIFVSSDRDEASFNEYFNEMPWAALKFDDRDLKQELAQMYGVSGIPTLVIVNKTGELVSSNARGAIGAKMSSGSPSAMNWD